MCVCGVCVQNSIFQVRKPRLDEDGQPTGWKMGKDLNVAWCLTALPAATAPLKERRRQSTPAEGQVGVPQLLGAETAPYHMGLLKIRQSLGMDSEGPDRSTALCPSHHCPGPLCP